MQFLVPLKIPLGCEVYDGWVECRVPDVNLYTATSAFDHSPVWKLGLVPSSWSTKHSLPYKKCKLIISTSSQKLTSLIDSLNFQVQHLFKIGVCLKNASLSQPSELTHTQAPTPHIHTRKSVEQEDFQKHKFLRNNKEEKNV